MAIDLDGILLISGLTALRLGIPILVMVALCKLTPICFPADTATTES